MPTGGRKYTQTSVKKVSSSKQMPMKKSPMVSQKMPKKMGKMYGK